MATEITLHLAKNDAAYKEIEPRVPLDKRELAKLLLPWVLQQTEKTDVQAGQ